MRVRGRVGLRRTRWTWRCGYWSAVCAAIVADGSIGWDDVAIVVLALVAWVLPSHLGE